MSFLPTVSVIIAAYNAQATLGACLTALKQLTYPHERVEVVVVDNASTDNTRPLAESFDVRVVTEAKRGPASARNRGIAATESEVMRSRTQIALCKKTGPPNWCSRCKIQGWG